MTDKGHALQLGQSFGYGNELDNPVLYGALKSWRIGSRNANGVRVRSFTICLGAMLEIRHAAMYLVGQSRMSISVKRSSHRRALGGNCSISFMVGVFVGGSADARYLSASRRNEKANRPVARDR